MADSKAQQAKGLLKGIHWTSTAVLYFCTILHASALTTHTHTHTTFGSKFYHMKCPAHGPSCLLEPTGDLEPVVSRKWATRATSNQGKPFAHILGPGVGSSSQVTLQSSKQDY
eukprot:2829848-Amphidinium_carterae.1